MLTTLIALFVLGILALIAIGIVLALFGAAVSIIMGIVGFLIFPVAPILLAGWLIMKLVRRSERRQRLSAADRRWLDQK
jgi:hypothetical protein